MICIQWADRPARTRKGLRAGKPVNDGTPVYCMIAEHIFLFVALDYHRSRA
jgi:hypothetical protein